jgi:uncharacterized membrane protein
LRIRAANLLASARACLIGAALDDRLLRMVASVFGDILRAEGIYDGGLPITEVFGLPLHPLVVHAAVVLLPLSALGLMFMATSVKRSKQYGGAVVLLSGVAAASAFLAMASGRDLAASLGYGPGQQHFDLGGWMPWVGLALFGTALLLWLADKKPAKRSGLGKVVALLSFVVAIGTIALTVWTGHLGASLTWG